MGHHLFSDYSRLLSEQVIKAISVIVWKDVLSERQHLLNCWI